MEKVKEGWRYRSVVAQHLLNTFEACGLMHGTADLSNPKYPSMLTVEEKDMSDENHKFVDQN